MDRHSLAVKAARLRALITRIALIAGVTMAAGIASASAQAPAPFPTQGFQVINPFPPGSPVEFVGRLVTQALEQAWPQHYAVLESRSGAGGTLGTNVVAKAPPNGSMLLVSTASPITVGAALYNKLPYDPARDLTPIWGLVTAGQLVVVNKDVPVRTLRELVDYARANPEKLSYASSGIGTVQHFAGELFKARTGAPLLHVPYRGGAPASADLVGGHVQVMFDSLTNQIANIQAGKVRPLAILRSRRDVKLPEVPTAAEAGVVGVELVGWISVFAPSRTPPDVVASLRDALGRGLSTPEARARITQTFGDAQYLSGPQLEKMLVEEIRLYTDLVQSAGITRQ